MRYMWTFGLEIDTLITFSYTGRNKKDAGVENGAEFVSFEDLLKISDFVIITCSYSPDLHKKFNKVNLNFKILKIYFLSIQNAFSLMKNSSILINTSRGGIIDQEDLVEALKSKQIFAAGRKRQYQN